MKEKRTWVYISLLGSLFIIAVPILMIFLAVRNYGDSRMERRQNEYAADDTVSGENDEILSEKEDGQFDFMEDKERNRTEGILYEIDGTQKETLTSDNGEICVKIPRWKGFSAELTSTNLRMYHAESYDSMTYELIAAWNPERVEKEIAKDLEFRCDYNNRDSVMGGVYHTTVNEMEIYYQSCYDFTKSECIKWYYMVWADLGCGQVLTTEIEQGTVSDEAWNRAYDYETVPKEVTEPLNIEGLIELLYVNIEVCTSEGEAIPITYGKSLPEKSEETFYDFAYGAVREYQADEYRETTVCGGLIDSLYEAVRTGGIEKLLRQEAVNGSELSIAEKMEYIKKEETGKLARCDMMYADKRKSPYRPYTPSEYYLLKGANDSEEFLVYSVYWFDFENNSRYDYLWFSCEKDAAGNVTAQKGFYIYGLENIDTREHYFLSYQGNPYLCIVKRDAKGEIEMLILYDFVTPDYIGTVICIDASHVYLSSYVRNGGSFGTVFPWYLHDDNKIDRGKVYFSMPKQWKITEYLGESDALHVEDTESAVYKREQKRTQDLADAYLGQTINMNWDVLSFHSASAYGYYYTSFENLYKKFAPPPTLDMEAPFSCAGVQVRGFDEAIVIITDKNGKAALWVENRFFRLEKSDEEVEEELRMWE